VTAELLTGVRIILPPYTAYDISSSFIVINATRRCLLYSRPRYTCLHLEREGANSLRFQICKLFDAFLIVWTAVHGHIGIMLDI